MVNDNIKQKILPQGPPLQYGREELVEEQKLSVWIYKNRDRSLIKERVGSYKIGKLYLKSF